MANQNKISISGSVLALVLVLVLSNWKILGFQCKILEKSKEFIELTRNFDNVFQKIEAYYVQQDPSIELTLEELNSAHDEMKSWDPRIAMEVKIRDLPAYLLSKLLVLHRELSFRNEEAGSVNNFKKLYRLFRPHYNLDRKNVKYPGKKVIKLSDSLLFDKKVDKAMFDSAMLEYEGFIDEYIAKSRTLEKEVKSLMPILDLISRVDVQIIKDRLFPIVRESVSPTLDVEMMRKLLKSEFMKQGYVVDEGVKVWLFRSANMQLFDSIYNPKE